MEEALTARLLNTSALSDLVGNRITWGRRHKKDRLPAITMMIVSPGRMYLHSGADATGNPRVQFDCYGSTTAEARAVKIALQTTLETAATRSGIAFSGSRLDSERGPLIENIGGGKSIHRYSLDFFVWFSPAA